MIRIIGGLVGLVLSYALVYGIINGVLYLVQDGTNAKSIAQLEDLKQQLASEESAIHAMENALDAEGAVLDKMSASLDASADRIESVERRYPDGVPSDAYIAYSLSVENHNAQVASYNTRVDSYQAAAARYEVAIADYNKLVDQANALAKEVGRGKWYVIPVPRGSKRSIRPR